MDFSDLRGEYQLDPLPPGEYLLSGDCQYEHQERRITLRAGETLRQDLTFPTATQEDLARGRKIREAITSELAGLHGHRWAGRYRGMGGALMLAPRSGFVHWRPACSGALISFGSVVESAGGALRLRPDNGPTFAAWTPRRVDTSSGPALSFAVRPLPVSELVLVSRGGRRFLVPPDGRAAFAAVPLPLQGREDAPMAPFAAEVVDFSDQEMGPPM